MSDVQAKIDAYIENDQFYLAFEAINSVECLQANLDFVLSCVKSDEIEQHDAFVALTNYGDAGLKSHVIPFLKDEWEVTRTDAIECLQAWGCIDEAHRIAECLDDESGLVIGYAAVALGTIGATQYAERLQSMLMDDLGDWLDCSLHEGLYRMTGDEKHLNELLAAVKGEKFPDARHSAYNGFSYLVFDLASSKPELVGISLDALRVGQRRFQREYESTQDDHLKSLVSGYQTIIEEHEGLEAELAAGNT